MWQTKVVEINQYRKDTEAIDRAITFFAVVLIVMKSESVVTGTLVAADRVLTDMLTSAVVRRAFVFIYGRPTKVEASYSKKIDENSKSL